MSKGMTMEEKCLTLAKVFEDEHNARVENFGLPSWLTCECSGCKLQLDIGSIQSVEIHFEPMFIGDISFNYFCKDCYTAFARHLKCDIEHVSELAGIFALKTCPAPMIDSSKLFSPSEHNIVKRIEMEQNLE